MKLLFLGKRNRMELAISDLKPIKNPTVQEILAIQYMKLPKRTMAMVVQLEDGSQELRFYRIARINLPDVQDIKLEIGDFAKWYKERTGEM